MTFRRSCKLAALWTAFAAVTIAPACGDLDVRRRVLVAGVPAALQGEWQGTWQSTVGADDGLLAIRVMEFVGQPVVDVAIDAPGLLSSAYQLEVRDDRVVWWLNGAPALEAQFASADRLVGTYTSALDSGTWTATKAAALPPAVDLSGPWSGEVLAAGAAAEPLRIELVQRLEAGALLLDATLELPTLLPVPVAMTGAVNFFANHFEVVLETGSGGTLQLVLAGNGPRDSLRIDAGVVQVLSGTGLPFTQAVFWLEPAVD